MFSKEEGIKQIDEAKWVKDDWGALNLYVSQPNGTMAHCFLTLRPEYCDRGHIQLMIDAVGMGIDGADSFPRFFFSFEEADHHTRTFLKWRIWKHRVYPHCLRNQVKENKNKDESIFDFDDAFDDCFVGRGKF